jgi:hypothetical protein
LHFESAAAEATFIDVPVSLTPGFSRVQLAATMLEPLQRFLCLGKPLKRLEDLAVCLPPR